MSYLWISLLLGLAAGLANLFGGAIVSARPWSRTFLYYFIALGSGFMLATVLTEMVPESLHLAPASGPVLILLGYFIVHFFEHSLPVHFHFGEETHADEFVHSRVAYTALVGLATHTFFDGVALTSGFLVSAWLGTVIFGATILHNVPEGFTMASIMVTANRRRAAMWSVAVLALSRIAGILVMAAMRHFVAWGLALSTGVTLYVAASDLIPEVNRTRMPRLILAVALGVAMVVLLRMIFFRHLTP
jgi:ZIP family zinc transporter/zinc and cadmium transporter